MLQPTDKLLTPLFFKKKKKRFRTLLYLYGSHLIYDEAIFLNILEGYALMCRFCIRHKDVFDNDFLSFEQVWIALHTINKLYFLGLFDNEKQENAC